jgi:hypothetical protein
MEDDVLNMSVRKFLKTVGVSSQRQIEESVRKAIADGRVTSGSTIPVRMTLEIETLDGLHVVKGEIKTS